MKEYHAQLPAFSTLNVKNIETQLKTLLDGHLLRLEAALANMTTPTWASLITLLEDFDDELAHFWSPIAHLHAVVNTKELRSAYKACLPLLSAYDSSLSHNKKLYAAVQAIDLSVLNKTQKKIILDLIKDFELSGVALDDVQKVRFEAIQLRLSELSNQYSDHVLDAIGAYTCHVLDEEKLAGIPAYAKDEASRQAKEAGLSGYLFTLEYPSFSAVVNFAEDRTLRQTLYEAFVTRASELGPQAGQFDNTAVMHEILALRHEKAKLLGFENFSALSLATKMASKQDVVLDFLHGLVKRARPQALSEIKALKAFAKAQYGIDELMPHDVAYFSYKKKEQEFNITEEALRPYFPLPKVLSGMREILKRLYGIEFERVDGVDTWHKDVMCFKVVDENHLLRGYIYFDLFARPNKQDGAWMDAYQSRRRLQDNQIQLPVAFLTCNFAKPSKGKPATLSHGEVLTLFHEMGHCLHHLLTQVDYLSASGINGVEWDAVELPSQFFENWCWDKEGLTLLTEHVDTKASLPAEMLDNLIKAKNFQSAMAMLRQMEFALFDFKIHQENIVTHPTLIEDVLGEVRLQTALIKPAPYNRFQHSFSHIFGGGYAAGYYSYSWADVLASDAFSRFEEEGVFNPKTGRDFLHTILEVGSSIPAKEAFCQFRGREAKIDALLKQNGIQG